MGFLDRLFGTTETTPAPPAPRRQTERSADEVAVERYRYLLRTAPPETIEQVHREAFAKLSDEQRALIYEELSRGAQTGERPLSSEPATLARAATRAELRQPGTMERAFAGNADGTRQGPGFGSMIASSLLGTVAGYVIGSALVSAFLPYDGGADSASDSGDGSGDDGSGDSGSGDSGSDAGGDAGATDAGGDYSGDVGGGFGDFGGGGGDFGGDFGF